MVRAMKLVAEMKKELSVEERNLLSVGYKNVIGSRRASWRTVVGIEAKALEKGDNQLKIETAQEYRQEIEQEMKAICNDALHMLDNYLIPLSTTKENQVFFYKMLVCGVIFSLWLFAPPWTLSVIRRCVVLLLY